MSEKRTLRLLVLSYFLLEKMTAWTRHSWTQVTLALENLHVESLQHQNITPIALGKAKMVYNFGIPECTRVNLLRLTVKRKLG